MTPRRTIGTDIRPRAAAAPRPMPTPTAPPPPSPAVRSSQPARPPRPAPTTLRPPQPRPRTSLEGLTPVRRPVPPSPAPAPPVTPIPAPTSPRPPQLRPTPPSTRPTPASQRSRPKLPGWLNRPWVAWLQYPLIAVAALAAAFNSTAGQVLVGVYGLIVLLRRLPARLSFGAALFMLLTVPLFQTLGRDGIAENAAIYVYELLVIGTISALIELRKSGDVTE